MTDQSMLHSDAFAWYMENDPVLRSTVVAVARLETEPDWTVLRERIDWLTRRVPQLRMRVQAPWLRIGPPRLTVDETFDLDYHLQHVGRAGTGEWADVLEFARTAAMDDFDRARPLWQFTLLSGLSDGGSAFVAKLHHSLTDGIGGVQLIALAIDGGPTPVDIGSLPDAPAGHRLSGLALTSRAAVDDVAEIVSGAGAVIRSMPADALRLVRHPVAELSRRVDTVASVSRFVAPTGPAPELTAHRGINRVLTTIDLPLDGLRDAAHAVDCHVNDAYLAALMHGVRAYHLLLGEDINRLRVTVPVSVRKRKDPIGGNRITLTRIGLRADIDDVRDRIRHVAVVMRRWRDEPALLLTQQIAMGLNLVPRGYLSGVFKGVDLVASDVPGIRQPVWLAGARVVAYYGFGPTIGAAFNTTLMSYAGTCNVGVNVDTSAISNPGLLVSCLQAGFDEVLTVGLSHRPTKYSNDADQGLC